MPIVDTREEVVKLERTPAYVLGILVGAGVKYPDWLDDCVEL